MRGEDLCITRSETKSLSFIKMTGAIVSAVGFLDRTPPPGKVGKQHHSSGYRISDAFLALAYC